MATFLLGQGKEEQEAALSFNTAEEEEEAEAAAEASGGPETWQQHFGTISWRPTFFVEQA